MRLLFNFSVPLLIGNIFQQFYNFADAIIVGKFLGYEALAAVGSTGAIMFFVFGFFFGLTSGLTVITGQRFGANDPEGVRKSTAASTIISTVFSIVSTAVAVPLVPQILALMNTPPEIIKDSTDYLTIMLWGTWTLVFYGFLSSLLRALGDSVTPLIFLVISCILNIGLDLIFVITFNWGVPGAAWATVAAQALSAVLCLIWILIRYPILHLHWCNWNVCRAFYMEHLRVSIPMALQFAITAVGVVIIQAVLNKFGPVYIAACTAASKIDSIAIAPMCSFGAAMAAYTAQNFGARKLDRIIKGVKSCTILSLAFTVCGAVLVVTFAKPLAHLFISKENPEVVQNTQIFLNICCSFYVVLSMLMIFRNVLQGMGNTVAPMFAGFVELLLRIVGALVLANIWGYKGVCLSHPMAWVGGTVILAIDYWIVMHKLKRDGIPDKNNLVRRTENLKTC